jgi:hypothetical protein
MMRALGSSETSSLTRATQFNVPENGIRHRCNVFCEVRNEEWFLLGCYAVWLL